jgi:hypothetical protein
MFIIHYISNGGKRMLHKVISSDLDVSCRYTAVSKFIKNYEARKGGLYRKSINILCVECRSCLDPKYDTCHEVVCDPEGSWDICDND